jgi:hypothetical protein
MDWFTILLVVVGAGVLYGVAWFAFSRGSPVEMPGGETILPAPEPAPPGKRWRLTIERS